MNTKTIRFMLTVPKDMAQKAEVLKKNMFYDKPYAEMYRQLIQIGIEKFQEQSDRTKKQITVSDYQKNQDTEKETTIQTI